SEDQVRQIVEIFLTTPFADGRHVRRIEKLRELEKEERHRAAK
ncbi:MAG: Ribose/Galactose Isomerase, partial [Phycisphaerales bacterium]|nr:Ribose/Galactose Isomerase [Phycisphaerales bacterium]